MPRATTLAARWGRTARSDALAFCIQVVAFVPLSLLRFVDGDEGVYAYASRLAMHGKLPYRDFFYEQMPLLPYVYGGWISIVGESWYGIRVLSALLTAVTGTLLYRRVRLRSGPAPAAVALGLFGASGLVLGYLTIVKTFALTGALLFGTYLLVTRNTTSTRTFVAAGTLLGLAIETRLVAVAALPAVLFASLRARQAVAFAAGLAASLVPAVALFASAPNAFVFDNLRYHALKHSGGLVGDFHQKGQTVATLLGLEPTDRALGIQFLMLLALCAITVGAHRLRSRAGLPLAIAASLGIASLLPTPTYVQYFSVSVPFLAVAAAEIVRVARHHLARLALVAGLCAYAAAAGVAGHHFTEHEALLEPSLASIRNVAATVESQTTAGERILSAWPGYLFGTHAWALPDYTNQFAPAAAAEVSPTTARRVKVASEEELERRIRDREVRVVVYRNWVTTPPFAHWDASLAAGRYRLVATVETARILRR
jgi:hypothetical protein